MTNPANILLIMLYLIVGIGLSACSTTDNAKRPLQAPQAMAYSDNAATFTLKGRVLADTQDYFTLRINDTTLTTDKNGYFQLDNTLLPSNKQLEITASEGVKTKHQVIHVEANQHYYVMINLASETTEPVTDAI